MKYAPEIGRVTGLPTASPMARFALTHEVALFGATTEGLAAKNEATHRILPFIESASDFTLERPYGDFGSWDDIAEWLVDGYEEAVRELHAEPLTPSSMVVRFLRALDQIAPVDRQWTNKIDIAFKYKSEKGEEKLQVAAYRKMHDLMLLGVQEGSRTAIAYLDVIARLAARKHPYDEEAAVLYCESLVTSSAPFIIELSGIGKRMNDVVIPNLVAERDAFEARKGRKYFGLRFAPERFTVHASMGPKGVTEYVTITDEARHDIFEEYNALPDGQKDKPELLGCPAHVAGGITKLYRKIAMIGFANQLFLDSISDEYLQLGMPLIDNEKVA